MLWTCPCCTFARVSWRPPTWSEAQVAAVARDLCNGRPSPVLYGARGFVRVGRRYAADVPIDCPRCRKSFYPGDALVRRPSQPAAPSPRRKGLPGHRSALH